MKTAHQKPTTIRLKGKALKKLYLQLVNEQGGLCEKCGSIAVDAHHLVKRSQGGDDSAENIRLLCRECHLKAHATNNKSLKEMS